MNHAHRSTPKSLLALLLLFLAAPTLAAVPLASREADRQAKFAVPRSNQALLYVYRATDKSAVPLTVVLNGRYSVSLDPRTFTMWRLSLGRVQLTAPGTTSALNFQVRGGRVYYVELSRSRSGIPVLRQVSFPVGRTEIHRSRLVGRTTTARPSTAKPAAPPAPAPTPKPKPKPKAAQTPVPVSAPAAAPRGRAKNFAIMLKTGAFKLASDSQTILSAQRAFDDSASSVYSIEGEWFVRPDISIGLEAMGFSNDYSTPSSASATGSTDTTAILFNAKRYFLPASAWQPYIGAGLGSAAADFSGAITGSTSGFALQGVAGVQWRSQTLALRAEYKYLKADTEDDNSQKVDMSGSGLFVGVGFYF
jgi:cell division septation protein DedD